MTKVGPMEASYQVLSSENVRGSPESFFALDVLEGLSQYPKRIAPVYLYNKSGSRLFQNITELKDYYLTECEAEILRDRVGEIISHLPAEPFNLVDLGAGDGRKTAFLLQGLLQRGCVFDYIPFDVSEEAMTELIDGLHEKFAGTGLKMKGLVARYLDALQWLVANSERKNFLLFLGSNIGNLEYDEILGFLRRLWNSLNRDDLLLMGFDLKKDIRILERAYDDPEGITGHFNLNLLDRINRQLGADFNLDRFIFHCRYNVASGAVESWLVSLESQEVYVEKLGRSFSFDAWEGIHTECSYKFLEPDLDYLASSTGFVIEEHFFDSRKYFVDSLWRVRKGREGEISANSRGKSRRPRGNP